MSSSTAGAEPTGSSRPETPPPDPVKGVASDLDSYGHCFPGSLTAAVQRELTVAGVGLRARNLLDAVLTVLDGARVPVNESKAIYGPLLAEISGVLPGHIARHANELVEVGMLKVERRTTRRPTLYARGDRLLSLTQPTTGPNQPDIDHANAPMRRDETGSPHHDGATVTHHGGATVTPWKRDRRSAMESRSRQGGDPLTGHGDPVTDHGDPAHCKQPPLGGSGDPPPCRQCGAPVPWHRKQRRWFLLCEACYRNGDRSAATAQPSRRQPVVTPRKPRKPFPKPDAAAQARVAAQIARLKEITENALANQPQPLRRSVQATPDR